jgi:hypothetical protein
MKTSVTLRLPEELKTKIKEEAEHNDMSVNQFILYTLTKEVSQKEAITVLKSHIKNAPSRKQALSLLDSIVPDIEPLTGDEIL